TYALANHLIRDTYDIGPSLATGFTNQALIDLKLTDYWPALRGQVSTNP
ncbi:MAG: nitrate ABC transporter substrate-binding protein, partial [Pseudomonas sp.]